MDPLLLSSATELAGKIRRREVSARQVVEAHIARTVRLTPTLNALVDQRFDEARAEADRADARIAREPAESLEPFLGVPCTVKECLGLRGLRQTSGLVARREVLAARDATAAARLRRAGFIPLGVTNVSELMMWMETYNHVYGRTNNPYDPRCTVGGSSGGEGAMVGAGASPVGLGSDIGGSIRMPAFFNGVFGHKPSAGVVPNTGHWPVAENDAQAYLATGPLTRRAEDLMPILRALAGPDGEDPACGEVQLGDPATVRIDDLTVYDVEDNGRVAVDPELKAAQRDAAAHLARLGARVRPLKHAALKRSFDIWSAMMDEAAETRFAVHLGNGAPIRLWRAVAGRVAGRRVHTIPALALAALEGLPALLGARAARAIALGRALKAELEAQVGPKGIILYPPFPRPAPRHYTPLLSPFDFQYTAIFNVLKWPVTQVPLGLSRSGLPLGVQVATVPGGDHVTIAVACALERAFGGWRPPPRWT